VYIGWNSICSGARFSVADRTQAAKLSMFELECTSMWLRARSKAQTAPAGSIGAAIARGQRSVRRTTCAARAKSPSTSPCVKAFSKTTLLPRFSCTSGAPGSAAATMSTSGASGS
jgi:hypothetical protein